MGCMHGFVWAETHPDFARAMMPMACLPIEIAGHNRMWRRAAVEGIRQRSGLAGAAITPPSRSRACAPPSALLQVAGFAPLYLQRAYPDRETAEAYIVERVDRDIATRDANDLIYQLEASRTYNPAAEPRAHQRADHLDQLAPTISSTRPITASPKPPRGECRPRATS